MNQEFTEQDPLIALFYLILALMTVICISEWIRRTGLKNIGEEIREFFEKNEFMLGLYPLLITAFMIIYYVLRYLICFYPFYFVDYFQVLVLSLWFCTFGYDFFIRLIDHVLGKYEISDKSIYLIHYVIVHGAYTSLMIVAALALERREGPYLGISLVYWFSIPIIANIIMKIVFHEIKIKESPLARKFRINEYLELRVINEETKIFINGMEFFQCKSLMLSIPSEAIPEYDEINSIDEALELNIIGNHHGLYPIKITPEEEFWGHCSNLQTWYENRYDPRLLHSNLAMPLLRALTKAGDSLAKIILKEEIVRQLENETLEVDNWVRLAHFLDDLSYFTSEELKDLNIFPSDKLSLVREKLFGDFREEEEDDNE